MIRVTRLRLADKSNISKAGEDRGLELSSKQLPDLGPCSPQSTIVDHFEKSLLKRNDKLYKKLGEVNLTHRKRFERWFMDGKQVERDSLFLFSEHGCVTL